MRAFCPRGRDRRARGQLVEQGTEALQSVRDRAQRDIENAVRAGRFSVRDPDLAMVTVAGAALCLGQFLHDHPGRDDAAAADQVTEDLLRMLGLPPGQAKQICQRPLPDFDTPPLSEAAG